MIDIELLELAAKAAGVPVYYSTDGTIQNRPILVTLCDGGMGTMPYEEEWNPLRDDATAFRLMVKMAFEIDIDSKRIAVRHSTGLKVLKSLGDNPNAAARRAIVEAAAEIGKVM